MLIAFSFRGCLSGNTCSLKDFSGMVFGGFRGIIVVDRCFVATCKWFVSATIDSSTPSTHQESGWRVRLEHPSYLAGDEQHSP